MVKRTVQVKGHPKFVFSFLRPCQSNFCAETSPQADGNCDLNCYQLYDFSELITDWKTKYMNTQVLEKFALPGRVFSRETSVTGCSIFERL